MYTQWCPINYEVDIVRNIINLFFILLGLISLGLGTVGIILPALPTVPFYLLTCFCFAKGSTRFHDWFLTTNLYKNHLEEFKRTRGLTLKKKLQVSIPASLFMFFSLVFATSWVVRTIIISALIFMWCYFLFRIKTLPPRWRPLKK